MWRSDDYTSFLEMGDVPCKIGGIDHELFANYLQNVLLSVCKTAHS